MAFDTETIVDEVIELTKRLVACFPVYGSDGISEAQQIVCEQLKTIDGMEVIVDKYSADSIKHLDGYINVCDFQDIYANYESVPKTNVYGIREGSGPTLILNGHIDVDIAGSTKEQNDDLRNTTADDRIFGRGTTDMLCGLSCMLICLKHFLKHHQVNNKIVFMSVCDEEIGGNGTLRANVTLDPFIALLPSKGYASSVFDVEAVTTKGNGSNVTLAIIAEPTECKYCTRSLGFSL
ncbi:hypothetical protein FACS1894122_14730 [Alphaproteobacteria bacterium]|nr:hypothetical protein FACS1894122_14730 [Alphaproteobacteria bacterium]